ncbi:5TMR of 5TMR-LYT [Anoxybacillus sp. BCO1]|nr:5TMR of 5TMR-LYT [Anoxybacillus sp. BCO1]
MMYGVAASFTALLCMMYPIQPLAKTNFDFRMIVILVTTLYIGKTAGLLCTFTVVIARFIIGGPFAYAGATVSVFAYVVGILFRSSFLTSKEKCYMAYDRFHFISFYISQRLYTPFRRFLGDFMSFTSPFLSPCF